MDTTETLTTTPARPNSDPAMIRRGGLCDLEAVAPLCAALRQECGRDQAAASQALSWLRYEVLAWGERLIVAVAGTEIVGYCAYNTRQAQLHEIYVAGTFRGQGIGRDLLAFAEREVGHSNLPAMGIAVDQAGEQARSFFTRHGFCPAATGELRLGWQKAL